MKKISLLLVMMLAFTVSVMAQSLPRPGNPKITEWRDTEPIVFDSEMYMTDMTAGYTLAYDTHKNPVADDYTRAKEDAGEPYTMLDPEKVSFSLFTDNDQIFTFTPELFDQVDEPTTRFPYTSIDANGYVGWWMITFGDFGGLTNRVDILAENGIEVDPFFTWRIGIQTYYTDNGETTASDIVYMEIYPQLQEAKNVTSTSFLADWSCEAENTYLINNFIGDGCGYFLHVIDKATETEILVQNVEPTNPIVDENGKALEFQIPGAFYTVEGLTPGNTYQYYVEVIQNTNASFKSVVREVTLPLNDVYMLGGDDQGWDPSQGAKFEYDAENNIYTLNYTFPAENNYFGFTTALAENNDQGGWDYIEQFRFGAVANEGTNFIWYEDQHNGQPISMTWDAYHAIQIPAGEYKLTINLTNMTLIIEKVVPDHGYEIGDVNHDHAVNIADVTTLIDYLLGTGSVCEICADVNGDGPINIADVTALIDKLLNIN